jgi:hypothetical protein
MKSVDHCIEPTWAARGGCLGNLSQVGVELGPKGFNYQGTRCIAHMELLIEPSDGPSHWGIREVPRDPIPPRVDLARSAPLSRDLDRESASGVGWGGEPMGFKGRVEADFPTTIVPYSIAPFHELPAYRHKEAWGLVLVRRDAEISVVPSFGEMETAYVDPLPDGSKVVAVVGADHRGAG